MSRLVKVPKNEGGKKKNIKRKKKNKKKNNNNNNNNKIMIKRLAHTHTNSLVWVPKFKTIESKLESSQRGNLM